MPGAITKYTSKRPAAVATGFDAVWVANLDGTVSRIDPGNRQVTNTIEVGGEPCGVAVGEGAVWVGDKDRDRVWKIDPEGNKQVGKAIEVEDDPCAIAAGDDAVWVANRGDSSLWRITP